MVLPTSTPQHYVRLAWLTLLPDSVAGLFQVQASTTLHTVIYFYNTSILDTEVQACR
jgi:hypothetical protein